MHPRKALRRGNRMWVLWKSIPEMREGRGEKRALFNNTLARRNMKKVRLHIAHHLLVWWKKEKYGWNMGNQKFSRGMELG